MSEGVMRSVPVVRNAKFKLCARATHPSFLLVAYLAAQAYSIYSLVPRKIKAEPVKKDEKPGRLKKILVAVQKSKILQFYEAYRYPLIPIGLQIFKNISQMTAFVDYTWSVPTRLTRIQ